MKNRHGHRSCRENRVGRVLATLLVLAWLAPPLAGALTPPANCQNDQQGANDEPGQKDLTRFCVDLGDGSPFELVSKWNWDDVTIPGGNTNDACVLFDTDNDGNANFVVCVTTRDGGNPASLGATRLFTCSDLRPDRCTGAVQLAVNKCSGGINNGLACSLESDCPAPGVCVPAAPANTTCQVSHPSDDPFPVDDAYPVDTDALCGVDFNDFSLPGSPRLLDACSYPSEQVNSDPSDCILSTECAVDGDCNDGNPCTIDTCNTLLGLCTFTPDTGAGCDDADACTVNDVCDSQGFCDGTPVTCDETTACTCGCPCPTTTTTTTITTTTTTTTASTTTSTTTTTEPTTTSTTVTTTTSTTTTTAPTTTSTTVTTTTVTTTTTQACGNGVIDAGEDCDPPGSITCPAGSPAQAFLACNNDCTCPEVPTTTTTASTTTSTTTTSTTTTTTSTTTATTSTTTTVTTTSSTTTTTLCVPQSSTECDPNVPGDCAAKCADTIDNDCDLLIDCTDPDCGPAICEGGTNDGQSCSTDAAIGACEAAGGTCVCPAIRKDPTTIRFGAPGAGLDIFASHGRVVTTAPIDVANSEVHWLVTNDATGQVVYEGVLLPGDLIPNAKGTLFRFRDNDARTGNGRRSGIYRAKIRITRGHISYGFKVMAYGDMSAATDPRMSIQFYIGAPARSFVHSEQWRRLSWGWKASGFE